MIMNQLNYIQLHTVWILEDVGTVDSEIIYVYDLMWGLTTDMQF